MSEHHRSPGWRRLHRTLKPQIEAALPLPCVERCGRLVQPGDQWDLSHIVPVSTALAAGWTRSEIDDPSNIGAGHRHCNRRAGGRQGAHTTNQRRETAQRGDRRMPRW